MILRMTGVRNVENSSVWIQVARGALKSESGQTQVCGQVKETHHLHRSQNSIRIDGYKLSGWGGSMA